MSRASTAAILAALLFPCAAALGAAAPPDDGQSPMREVVVTAIPPSPLPDDNGRSSVSEERLLDLQVKSPSDLGGLSPNLVTLGGGERGLDTITSMRGLANSPAFTDPAVVYYIDGVPSASPLMNTFDWHELSSLNVWKGPQEIRFGRNAPAGVIEIEEDAPQPVYSARASADYGSYDSRDVFGEFSGPIQGTDVSYLAAFHAASSDGYLTNTTLGTRPGGQNEIGGRFALLWKPAATPWTFDLNVAQTVDRDGVQALTPLSGPRYQIASLQDGSNDLQSGVQSLRARYDDADWEATLVSSHRSYSLDPNQIDLGFGGASFISTGTAKEDQYMQEIRVASKGDAALRWQAGGSYQRIGFSGTTDLGGLSGLGVDTTYNQYAAFGSVTVKPVEKLSLTLGNRFQADDKEAGRIDTSPFLATTTDREQHTWLNFAPKLEASYAATEAVTVFGSSSLAFRPGGYAPFPSTTTLVEPYGSEQTWANEIGVGYASPGQHRFQTSVSLFWNETYHYQLERYQTPLIDVVNVPEVASRGVEWETELRPADGLTLDANVSYTRSTFVDDTDGVTGQNYQGNDVPFIPRMTWLLEATYRRPEGWTAHVDARGLGDTDFDQANAPLYRQDAYAVLDCRLGYEAPHWSVYLYGKNLTDTQYSTFIDSSLNAQISGDPQTFGVESTVKW